MFAAFCERIQGNVTGWIGYRVRSNASTPAITLGLLWPLCTLLPSPKDGNEPCPGRRSIGDSKAGSATDIGSTMAKNQSAEIVGA